MAIIAVIKLPAQKINVSVPSINSPVTTPEIDLKNNPASLKINNFASLADVDTTGATDGAVLVYNANTATYQFRKIDDGTF